MADETFTKADFDKALKDAVDEATQGLKDNLKEALDEAKEAKRKLRAASEIKPEDMAALEADNEKLRTDLAAATKAAKEATATAEKATKALETEQAAARSYAIDAELNAAIAEGNIVPALVPALTAMMKGQTSAELTDGKYAVKIGDKPAREAIKALLETDDGKAFKAASLNGGGGSGGGGGKGGGKVIDEATFNAMPPKQRAAAMAEGATIAPAA